MAKSYQSAFAFFCAGRTFKVCRFFKLMSTFLLFKALGYFSSIHVAPNARYTKARFSRAMKLPGNCSHVPAVPQTFPSLRIALANYIFIARLDTLQRAI